MKTYHMYHVETINAETKLREAERQEGRVKGVSGTGGGVEPVFGLRIEERHQRRNAARKMEKMREKVTLLDKWDVLFLLGNTWFSVKIPLAYCSSWMILGEFNLNLMG